MLKRVWRFWLTLRRERRAVLLEWAAFADFLVERMPVLEQEWRARRDALRASGELPDDSAGHQ